MLNKIMQMACAPFEKWGAEGDEKQDEELDAEIREERRFCAFNLLLLVAKALTISFRRCRKFRYAWIPVQLFKLSLLAL